MKMHDVTGTIFEGMAVYKDKPEKQPKMNPQTTGEVTETQLEMNVHTGTHIDAPRHMMMDGETFESISLDKLVGPCKVLDLTAAENGISKADLKRFDIQQDDFILLKTKNSFEENFNFDFVYLAEDGAAYLSELGIRGVGTDALGIERSQEGHPTHKALFAGGIIIIEGLRLKEVEQGDYFMVAAPLKLTGTDASPARVLLFDELHF
ncbi:cyclase family protein [Microbacterium sp. APC 3898]|uniref:Cyclase family protein n=1 Tax=Planococcus notacanthi TaxID=3035188 RepID=A0ABT7ZJS7_9BACL|nr:MULTISPECIES: cyclase family protein [Terrabacteria group]MDN3427415.1 cyclase family protein [Planococcus sp. APC 4016]MDN3436766.1 cyclase family protein [Planococcus sp. APC 3900]MDN3499699.1 cyclase family protein [Microbacterium sp. APC 3898]